MPSNHKIVRGVFFEMIFDISFNAQFSKSVSMLIISDFGWARHQSGPTTLRGVMVALVPHVLRLGNIRCALPCIYHKSNCHAGKIQRIVPPSLRTSQVSVLGNLMHSRRLTSYNLVLN